MEYSTTGSPLNHAPKSKSVMSSIDPNKELFDSSSGGGGKGGGPSAPAPASAPPPPGVVSDDDDDHREAMEREIEGGGSEDGGDQTLHLSVTDPQQIGEGRSAHTFYRIDVRRGRYTSDAIASVRRRYSDFQWLFQRLHAERPGSIVPIIPHTQAVQLSKRMSEELIEERRVHLEGFLRKVQVHPELEGAPSLSAFFSPDAEVFEAAKKANPGNGDDLEDVTPTEKAKEKVKHFFVKAGIKARVASGGELEETRDGAQMEEVEHYLSTLESHVKALSKATMFLVNSSKETSTTMHELGQSLFGLHQTYDPETATNNDDDPPKNSNLPTCKAISNILASLAAINKVKHDEDQSKTGRIMVDIEWSIKAARLALKRRKNCQLTYNTYLQQIRNREGALEKLNKAAAISPQPGEKDQQIATAQKSLESSRQSTSKALGDLDAVTARVFREMTRFKREVDEELRQLYVSHAKVQVDYSRQLETEWRKLLPNNGGSNGSVGGTASARSSFSGASDNKAETLMI